MAISKTLGGGNVGAAVLFAQLQILLQRKFFLACGFEALLEVAKDTHDVTSLDTWSRRRITQSMLATARFAALLFTPQNTFADPTTPKATPDDPCAGVPALPCFGWPALKDSSEFGRERRDT
jgi:hypothetical protein